MGQQDADVRLIDASAAVDGRPAHAVGSGGGA
jgi:hypothetical protein